MAMSLANVVTIKKKKYKKRKDGRYATIVTIGRDIETGKPIKVFVYGHTIDELKNNVLEVKLKKKQGFLSLLLHLKNIEKNGTKRRNLLLTKIVQIRLRCMTIFLKLLLSLSITLN